MSYRADTLPFPSISRARRRPTCRRRIAFVCRLQTRTPAAEAAPVGPSPAVFRRARPALVHLSSCPFDPERVRVAPSSTRRHTRSAPAHTLVRWLSQKGLLTRSASGRGEPAIRSERKSSLRAAFRRARRMGEERVGMRPDYRCTTVFTGRAAMRRGRSVCDRLLRPAGGPARGSEEGCSCSGHQSARRKASKSDRS